MGKITEEMIKAVYSYARKVFNNEVDIDKAVNSLTSEESMNETSARSYIQAYIAMRNGKNFKFTMQKFAYKYYLENIKKDDGKEAALLAAESVKQHFERYKTYGKGNLFGVEAIYNEFIKSCKIL